MDMDMDNYRSTGGGVCEIEEEEDDDNQIHHHDVLVPTATIHGGEEEDCVYVAVGKSDTSMDALSWTLKNLATQSTMIYLIHVFPEINHIPNPLGIGMIPRNQVSGEQVESYIAQERGKRRELLQKFLQSCSTSKVKVDTILIESDLVAKAILDLIPILQITSLVIGTNKRKSKSRKGNGLADQIPQKAPQSCKVRIICEGKEIINEQIMSLSPSPHALTTSTSANDTSTTSKKEEDHQHDYSVSCICFTHKFK